MIADLLAAAMQYHRAGILPEAERLYREVLQRQPDQPNALYSLGLLFHQSGDLETAIAFYQQALAAHPNFADAHNNLGAAFQQQGNLTAAVAHYQSALRLKPANPNTNVNLGVTLQQQGNLSAAIARYQRALSFDAALPEAHSNLAHALKEQGNLEQAIAHYQTVLQLTPDNPDAYRDLADALVEQGSIREAIALLDQGIARFPNHVKLRGSRIRARLVSGDLQAGFAEYDPWRLRMAETPRTFTQPAWDGADLDRKPILLYTEAGAGMGDLMQFIRYAPLVADRGGRVQVESPAALVRLFQQITGVETVVAIGDPLPPFEVQASILSLPYLFNTSLETIPVSLPYLSAPPSTFHFPIPPSHQLKVGIVWGGDPNHLHDRERSCPIEALKSLLQLPGIQFYSLQKGPHQQEFSELGDLPIQDLSDRLNDFADTAAAIAQLDLVISVDTSVAHLAGAMGKPVWILLSFFPDWRWLRHREDSPWYPTARLFRQPHRNGWTAVCAWVAAALSSYQKSGV